MTYRVQFSPHAAREYRKLDAAIKPDLAAALDALQHQPLVGPKIKRLKGRLREYYRYRMGDYRVAYVIDTKTRTVLVDYIQHRGEIYRRME